MIPDGVSGVVSFLLLLAPGIVWELQRGKHVPAVKETTLVEISRIVLASLAATAVAAVALAWVWLPLYRDATGPGFDEASSEASSVRYVAAVVATSALACGLTLVIAAFKWREPPRMSGVRVWHRAFVEWNPSEKVSPRLIVELLDGTVWRGRLLAFDADPEDAQRGVAIGQPLKRKRPGQAAFEAADPMWHTVVLPESQIKSVRVGYPDAEDATS